MAGRWDTIDTADGPMRCYVSGTEGPAIIIAQHAGGVDDFVCGMTDRFGGEGFVALAPDLYHREDPASKDDPMTRMSRLRDPTIVSDINATVEHARTLGDVSGDAMGVTGFCMGGRVAYLMASQNAAFKASVVFWGGNIMVPWGDRPSPYDLSDKIGCPILGLFGDDDPNPSPSDVARISSELSRLGKPHEFHGYAGAGHAFMNESRPSYREEASKDAWQKAIAFFNRYLKP